MNRIHPRTAMRRLSPRATVISGAALGLLAGVAVYGAVSSSAAAPKVAAFTAAKVPVAAAPASFKNCAKGQKLEKGVCVIHVVRTVVAPSATGAAATGSGRAAGATPSSTSKPSSAAKPASVAKPSSAAQRSTAPVASSNPETTSGDDGEHATTTAPLSKYDAAVLAAKNAAALAAKDAATLGANNPTTLAANKAATQAAAYAASLAPVNAG